MLLTVSDQIIIIILLCKWVSAYICIFGGIYGFVWIVNTNVNTTVNINVNVETSA